MAGHPHQVETAVKRANLRGLLFASSDERAQRACAELQRLGRVAWVGETRSSVGGWVWLPSTTSVPLVPSAPGRRSI
jgi:hypothetical protein